MSEDTGQPRSTGQPGAPNEKLTDESRRVAACWDSSAEQRPTTLARGWMDAPLMHEHHFRPAVTHSEHKHWIQALMKDVGLPGGQGRWLSLGCGSGETEIHCLEQGLCSELVAYDLSTRSLAMARESAEHKGVRGIEFRHGNFHHLPLGRNVFDVVVMSMSLHHVAVLTPLLTRIRRALKPSGWLLINEYVGPAQLQLGNLQIEITNELLARLPPGLRRNYVEGGTKERYVRRPREFWQVVDPSEAICSDEILPALYRDFRVAAHRGYGGALLHPLFEHIVANFQSDDEKDVALLRLLTYFEGLLTRRGILKDDFAVLAAQPRHGLVLALARLWHGPRWLKVRLRKKGPQVRRLLAPPVRLARRLLRTVSRVRRSSPSA